MMNFPILNSTLSEDLFTENNDINKYIGIRLALIFEYLKFGLLFHLLPLENNLC